MRVSWVAATIWAKRQVRAAGGGIEGWGGGWGADLPAANGSPMSSTTRFFLASSVLKS